MRIALPSPVDTWVACAGALAMLTGLLTYALGPLMAAGVAGVAAMGTAPSWRTWWADVREHLLPRAGVAGEPVQWSLEWSEDHWRLWRGRASTHGCSVPVRVQVAFSCAAGVLLRLDTPTAPEGLGGCRWWWLPLSAAEARGRRLRLLMASA